MAEIALKGKMKVKTLKAEFKKVFGATLRVYNDVTCRGEYADDNATLASIRTEFHSNSWIRTLSDDHCCMVNAIFVC